MSAVISPFLAFRTLVNLVPEVSGVRQIICRSSIAREKHRFDEGVPECVGARSASEP
jgi:hypothetical protein